MFVIKTVCIREASIILGKGCFDGVVEEVKLHLQDAKAVIKSDAVAGSKMYLFKLRL